MELDPRRVLVPVSYMDRAKAFYLDQLGFNVDYDPRYSGEVRWVQLTPPGSGCSIAIRQGPQSSGGRSTCRPARSRGCN